MSTPENEIHSDMLLLWSLVPANDQNMWIYVIRYGITYPEMQ